MELSSYAFEPLPHDDEFTLYRGGQSSQDADARHGFEDPK